MVTDTGPEPTWRQRASDLFWRHQLSICLAVRMFLIAYSYLHDSVFTVSYTDIDYAVFSNASLLMLNGESPYRESEYRYSPLIAGVTVGNWLLHSGFGKCAFAAADLACGCLLAGMTAGWPAAATWLWNPIVLGVSSRGSAEPVILLCVLVCLRCLLAGRYAACGLALGLAVHAKLYPVIYGPAICLHVWRTSRDTRQAACRLARLVACAGLGFGVPLALFYRCYGNEFIEQAYLYHFGRLDPQHNFSVYFLPMRRLTEWPRLLRAVSGLAFALQSASVLFFAWAVPHPGPCWFFTTFAFVSLNKVITSQYFLWYLIFLPLALRRLSMGARPLCQLAAAWLLPQAAWLGLAYLLEFRRWPIVELVWLASLLVLLGNAWIARRMYLRYGDATACGDATDRKKRR